MFSLFTARRSGEPGSGGKVTRERRRAGPAVPYARPDNSQPAARPTAGNPRWLSGIVAGAGRLLSSVLRSESGESSSSYSSDSGGGGRDSDDEDDNAQICSTKFHGLDKTGGSTSKEREAPSLFERNERRLAIEKLLLQETFSRVERDRLIKIIESRVVDTMEIGSMSHKDPSGVTLTGTSSSTKHKDKFLEGLAFFTNHQNDHSPGISFIHTYSHDLCDRAILEAKKWIEERKVESTSKAELECRLFTLNNKDIQHHVDDGVGSPVDVAKSYMRERPLWQSPILSHIELKTTPIGVHQCDKEGLYSTGADPSSRSKELKRSYLVDAFDDVQSVHVKRLENPPNGEVLQQVGSSGGATDCEAHQTANEGNILISSTNNDLISTSATVTSMPVDVSTCVPEKLTIDDSCCEVFLNSNGIPIHVDNLKLLPSSGMMKVIYSSESLDGKLALEDERLEAVSSPQDGKASKVNCLTNYEVNIDAEDNIDEANVNSEISAQTVLPTENARLQSLSSVSDHPDLGQSGANKNCCFVQDSTDVSNFKTNQDLKGSREMEKQANKVPAPNEFASHESSSYQNNTGDGVEHVPAPVSDVEVPLPGNCNQGQDLNGFSVLASGSHIDSVSIAMEQDAGVPQSELIPVFEVTNTTVDMELSAGNNFNKGALSATRCTPNGELSIQPGLESNPYIVYLKKGGHPLSASSNGLPGAAPPSEGRQLPAETSIDSPVGEDGFSGLPRKQQNGTTMKSIEQMLAENVPRTRRGRGRTVPVKPRRGRGRGRGRRLS